MPAIPPALGGKLASKLWIIQFDRRPTEAMRHSIRSAGGELHGYLPENAYIVRISPERAPALSNLVHARWVGRYAPAFRLEPFLLAEYLAGIHTPVRPYNIVVVDKHEDKPALAAKIRAIGGAVLREQPGSILFEAALSGTQLGQVASFDEVLWIDRWSPPEEDMNNARIQGGANFIESAGGYTGTGVNGHVYEGLEAAHPDFTHTPINVQSCGSAQRHGHCTAGIIFGNGTSHPLARGMAPDAQPFYTNYSCVTPGMSRWQVIQDLVTHHEVMFTTASWGNARTRQYTSISADTDDIIFNHDIPWTQSQSNARSQDSRPQAWAKNVFSIGGVVHFDNADRRDDSWDRGGASTGPAADGRIKPDLCAYYDEILCSDLTGSAGYNPNGDFFSSFGGTSGATPIVAGHNALAIQMFTDHIFNNPPRVPGGTRFQNRPHFTTLKALMIANARQYAFDIASLDNRREHQGWGFPDLKTMLENAGRMLLVDETDLLTQGQSRTYPIPVSGSEPELKIAMTYADPAANPAASITRINDLSLKVTAPDGTIYWGNHGLKEGNYSSPGGSADDRDTVECVFVHSPSPGLWNVEVKASLIAQDSHVETPAVDADFGLCVTFGTHVGVISSFGQGCIGTGLTPGYCEAINPQGGILQRRFISDEFAYQMRSGSALNIVGFRLWTASTTANTETVTTGFYRDAGGSPDLNPLTTSSMQVGVAEQFYDTLFSQPISVGAGETFYVACDHGLCHLSTLVSGTRGHAFARAPRSGEHWRLASLARFPSVQILCQGGGGQSAAPLFELSGAAEIGTTLDLSLSRAARRTLAVLFTGFSSQRWNGVPLPFDLMVLGASGCSLLVSPDLSVPFPTGSEGSVQYPLPIPVDPNLVGAELYQQFAVIDPGANQLGVVTSNAAGVSIGR